MWWCGSVLQLYYFWCLGENSSENMPLLRVVTLMWPVWFLLCCFKSHFNQKWSSKMVELSKKVLSRCRYRKVVIIKAVVLNKKKWANPNWELKPKCVVFGLHLSQMMCFPGKQWSCHWHSPQPCPSMNIDHVWRRPCGSKQVSQRF